MFTRDDAKLGGVFVVLFVLGMGLGALQGCHIPRRPIQVDEVVCEWITPRLSKCVKTYCRDSMGRYSPCPAPKAPEIHQGRNG